jgi:hypothetical protein
MSYKGKRNSISYGINNFKSSNIKSINSKKSKKDSKISTKASFKTDDIKEINNIIKEKNLSNRIYSKSFAQTYIPLSKQEKVKEIHNMNESSFNRFKTYSTIFERIKKEICDINTNLNNSLHIKKLSNDILKDYNMKIDIPIEEQDDENCSPLQIKTKNKIKIPFSQRGENEKTNNSNLLNDNDISLINSNSIIINSNETSDFIDDDINISSLNENVQKIVIRPTEQSESMQSMRLKNKIMRNKCLDRHNSFRKYQLMNEKKFVLYEKIIPEQNDEFYHHTNEKNISPSCNCTLQ